MKIKILTSILLFSWIFQIGFPYMKYELRRRECWQQFLNNKDSFSPDEIRQFDLNKLRENISWEREGKEFKLNGDFYDVIKIERTKNSQLAFCVADKDETMLLRAYENFLKHQHKKKSATKLKKISYFFDLKQESEVADFSTNRRAHSFQKGFNEIAEEVYSPPPEFIV